MALLSPGDTFPKLTITVPGGQTLTLPDALAGDFGVVLFYRGSWCPYCNAQLRAFQRSSGALAEAGIRMIALSVDDEATTAELISQARPHLPGRPQRRRRRGVRTDGRLRQPGPALPAVHRLRPRPRRPRRRQRVLQRRHRPARASAPCAQPSLIASSGCLTSQTGHR